AQGLIRLCLLLILAVNPLHRSQALHHGSSTSYSPSLGRVLSSKPRSSLHRNRKHKDPLKPKHPIFASWFMLTRGELLSVKRIR
ncbi:hypothetical protein HID58_055879, partial [Brassica napus]